MNLSLPITYNSLSINTVVTAAGGVPSSGYQVDKIDTSDIEVAAYFEKKALSDGIDASDVYLGRRRVGAIVTVFGSTHGDFWDKAQDLLAAFSPTLALSADTASLGFLPFDFYQPTADIVTWPTSAYPSGIPLRYYLRPTALPSYEMDRDTDGGTSAKGLSKKFRLALVAREPWKVTQALNTSTAATWTALGDTPALPYISIAATSATGTWTASVNGSAWTVNVDGSVLTQAQIAIRNKWVLDSRHGTLWGPAASGVGSSTSDSETSNVYSSLVPRMDRLGDGSAFPSLAIGANARTTGGTLGAAVTAKWRDAFS